MTMIYAHRGANREAMENTRAAFDKALGYPIDGIETDVQLSRDAIAVLWHDRFLNKIGLPDRHIDDFDLAQLQAMHFAGEEGPMTLQDFVDAYRQRCRLLLEIKNREWESVARQQLKVRQTLAAAGGSDDILISSFNLDSLSYAHRCAPEAKLIGNLDTGQTDIAPILSAHPWLHGICLPVASLNEAAVRLLRAHRLCIAVYTCNSDAQIKLALALGVDILISDLPQRALSMRDE